MFRRTIKRLRSDLYKDDPYKELDVMLNVSIIMAKETRAFHLAMALVSQNELSVVNNIEL